MAPLNRELKLLLNQIDDWFDDISLIKPISQFKLDDDVDNINEIKPYTEEKHEHDEEDEDGALDSLAKDLEQLLEDSIGDDCQQHEKVKGNRASASSVAALVREDEPKIHFYNSFVDDERTLLEDSIGYCCTLFYDSRKRFKDHLSSLEENKGFSVVVQTLLDGSSYEKKPEISQQHQLEVHVSTSMPPDHDYLPKLKGKPLALNSRLKQIQIVRNKQRGTSVLNVEALKRFAPFSDKFRELSSKQDKLLAIVDKE